MEKSLSKSARWLIAGILIVLLGGQLIFSSTYAIGQTYAHNGRISHTNKQWKETVWFYNNATQWYPYSHHWWYSIGVGKKEDGDIQGAIDAMEQGVIRAPSFVLGFIRAATLKYQMKDIKVATSLTEQVDALVPWHVEVKYLQGLLLANDGKKQDAMKLLLGARRDALKPHASIEALLAYTANETGQPDIALEAASQLTKLQPSIAKHWLAKGKAHRQLGQKKQAIEKYQHAISLYAKQYVAMPKTAYLQTSLPFGIVEAYSALGELRIEEGLYTQALNSFYSATELYAELNKSEKALNELASQSKQLLDKDRVKLACVLSAGRQWSSAIGIFEALVADPSSNLNSMGHYRYGISLRNSGQYDLALEQFRAMSNRPFIPSLAYADTLRVSGQKEAARLEYTKILNVYQSGLSDRQRDELTVLIKNLSS